MDLRRDCDQIAAGAIARVLPGEAVRRALRGRDFGSGRLILAAVGKAACFGIAWWDQCALDWKCQALCLAGIWLLAARVVSIPLCTLEH